MRSRNLSIGLAAAALVALTVFGTAARVTAQERVLHSFSGRDGYDVFSGLTMDASGNLYGTTSGFGLYDGGTAFELTPVGASWKQTVLHNFGKGSDAANPYAGLIFDASGNLYGTTLQGGTYGWGTVFELTPTAGGTWTEKVLHSFNLLNESASEATPYGGLVLDASGNLYGTTWVGGEHGVGTVFELTPTAGGNWTETVLYAFLQNGIDANSPFSSLIFDASGNLYGTSLYGGVYGTCNGAEDACGTVFELMPVAGGGWTEKVLHSFNNSGTDGNLPRSALVFDTKGNLYGTTVDGGTSPNCSTYGCGIVFELTPTAGGNWTELVLHNFGDTSTDGTGPSSGLIFDATGSLYGTTLYGGASSAGTAFELVRTGGGWAERILHNFTDNGKDGYAPNAGLIFDSSGNLYGTTYSGGTYGSTYEGGTVFEVKR
jgi:uncharacterized repeat protein (TIGR03803 family)